MKAEYRPLAERLRAYRPVNEQEARDRELMQELLERGERPFERANRTAHFTASAWVTNARRDRVLMVYHNLYRSWAWTGGHADGETDLCAVARREAEEESGLSGLELLADGPISLEILTVDGHEKRGEYVSSHLHCNLTYLFVADDGQETRVKPDENSGVRWFSPEEAIAACSEPWMARHIYPKLNRRLSERLDEEKSDEQEVDGSADV